MTPTTKHLPLLLLILLAAVLLGPAHALRSRRSPLRHHGVRTAHTALHATTTSRWVAASAFAACLALGGGSGPAWAKDSDGTKQDKKFELCVSKCVFLATKPPPMGSDTQRLEETSSRTRVEILRDCRSDCATTKEQRLLGKPKAQKAAPMQQQQ